jgi:hypothetical protein
MENPAPAPASDTGTTAAAPAGSRPRHGARGRREPGHGPFLPLLLLGVAAIAWPAFQCYQLVNEKQALATVFGNQAKPFEDSGKLRSSLDGLIRETALLAGKGHAGAKLIVDELARRGVTVSPDAPPGEPPKAGK